MNINRSYLNMLLPLKVGSIKAEDISVICAYRRSEERGSEELQGGEVVMREAGIAHGMSKSLIERNLRVAEIVVSIWCKGLRLL